MITRAILQYCHSEGFEEDEIYGAYKIFFGTLVSESRLRILNLLRKKEMNVSEIMTKLRTDQTSTSHDLSRLKKCGFVNSNINGKYRYYKINEETINPLMTLIDKHMARHCVYILKSDKKSSSLNFQKKIQKGGKK